jgi:polygalacturonase
VLFSTKITEFCLVDSSQDVCIEDCYISVGDDAIAIKSGWDEYGTSYGMPSKHIDVRRIIVHSTTSAGIAFGSEMSGGISDVKVSIPCP